jgi:Tfp pilus assembly protein PilV
VPEPLHSGNPLASAQQGGFGLVDVLVALLLLTLSLLAAGATSLRSLQASRAALLQLAGTDLATDLSEALDAAATPEALAAVVADWRARAAAALPATALLAVDVDPVGTRADVPHLLRTARIAWHETSGDTQQLILPLAPGTRGGS